MARRRVKDKQPGGAKGHFAGTQQQATNSEGLGVRGTTTVAEETVLGHVEIGWTCQILTGFVEQAMISLASSGIVTDH